ncbi:MAG: tryptophan synthase subunit alpha [Treponemataceae bacterium]|nr:tryptophan synthase subunit alpha [Treponemataceae bacterium]
MKDDKQKDKRILMAHQVAGYPDDGTCLAAGEALIAGGADILEVQLAFSDPSADGAAIQTACSAVLAAGYTVRRGMDYVREIRRRHPETPVYIMTYASLAYRPGIGSFVQMAADAGAAGLIIPDLPFDHDEGLGAACRERGIRHVPVAAPSMTAGRLEAMAHGGYECIYTALRAGITGSKTVITPEMLGFIGKASSGGAKIFGGFGITDARQAEQLAPHVHAVVAGSVFVNLITKNYDARNAGASCEKIAAALRAKAAELAGLSGAE